MQPTEQYSTVVYSVILHKVVLTFESVDEILKDDHSNAIYWVVLYCGVLGYSVQGGSNFWVCGWNPNMTIQMKATEQYSPAVLFIMLCKVVLSFETVDEILKCDYSNESYTAVLSFGAVYYAVQGGATCGSVGEILKCDHLNESYWAVLSRGAIYYAVQGYSNFWVWGWNPKVWPFKWKLFSSTFLWCRLCCTKWFSRLSLWMKS